MHMKSIQEMAAAAAATCGQGSDCRNNAHLVMSILNAIQKNISVHKFHIRSKRAGSIVFHNSRSASVFENDNKEAKVTTSAAAKESDDFLDKDAEILRQRLKDLSKSIKNASEKEKNEETARH